MSQPNDPDNNKSANTPPAPTGASPAGPAGSSADGPESSASTTTPRGGLVPPWQRGPGGSPAAPAGPAASIPGSPSTNPTEQLPRPAEGLTEQLGAPAQRNGAGSSSTPGQSGPAPRGVVSGDAPASQAPVTKLDAPTAGQVAAGQAAGAARPRFQEVPTRTIARDPSVDAGLPDLDEIHHTDAAAAAAAAKGAAASRPTPAQVGSAGKGLRAAVQIRRLDPWAMFKVAGVLAIVGFVIWMIAIAVLYLVLDGMGVWDQVNNGFGTLVTSDGVATDVIGAGSVFLYAALLGIVGSVLLTALATIGAYIYNLVADMVGGIEVTLADLD